MQKNEAIEIAQQIISLCNIISERFIKLEKRLSGIEKKTSTGNRCNFYDCPANYTQSGCTSSKFSTCSYRIKPE